MKIQRVRLAALSALLAAQLVACGTSPISTVGAKPDDSQHGTSQIGSASNRLTIRVAGREKSTSDLLEQTVYAYFERSACSSPRTNPIVSAPSQISSIRFTAKTQQSFLIEEAVTDNSTNSLSLASDERWYYKIKMKDGSHWFILAAPLLRELFRDATEFSRATDCYGTFDVVATNAYKAEKAAEQRKAEEAAAIEAQRIRQRNEAEWQARGGVKLGMTPDQVERSQWGSPTNKSVTESQLGVMEFWFFSGGRLLTFLNGKVTTIGTQK